MNIAAADDAGPVERSIDGPLGRWTFLEWRPPRLRPWIESFWLFEGRIELRRERTFPAAEFDLILQLEGRYRPGDDPAASPFPIASVNGVLLGPHIVESPPAHVRVLGIRVRAEGAHALLGGVAPHLTGVTADLEDLLGAEARELAGRCHDAANPGALVEAARFVERRLARAPDEDAAVAWAAARIRATGGRSVIAGLAEQLGLSPSTLARRCRSRIGITPKRLARVHRFRRVLEALHAGPGDSLSSIALAAGYYDQPHMNADFRELAGLAPTEYLAAMRYPGSPSLAEAS